MEKNEFKLLLERYLEGKCTPEEEILIQNWYLDVIEQSDDKDLPEPDFEAAEQRLSQALRIDIRRPVKIHYRYAAAASILFAVFSVFYYAREKNKERSKVNQEAIM